MKVPLLDLTAQYRPLAEQFTAVMERVASTQALILGPEVDALERELADYLGVKHAIGVSSGTDALLMALMALGIGPGDEVIMPTYSFFATAGAVVRVGATPVFVDSEPVGLTVDPAKVEAAITERTKAIMPVHLFGQAADMEAIMNIAADRGVDVIEDAAQAIGTQARDGRRVGAIGMIGCFSFYPTKNLGAFGDAGLVTTNDDEKAGLLKRIRNHGMEPRYHHAIVGGNFRIDALQAAVLRVKLPHLPSWHAARRANAARYDALFTEAGLSERPGVLDFDARNRVLLPAALNGDAGHEDHHIVNQYSVRVERRDELRAFLTGRGIGTEIYYPVPFHRQECFTYLDAGDDFPVANRAAAESLALPIYPELSPEQQRAVVEAIAAFLNP